jgi:hypothetical protein
VTVGVSHGDIVSCPNCKDKIATVIGELFVGELLCPQHLLFTRGQKHPDGFTICMLCQTSWFKTETGIVHTERGWRGANGSTGMVEVATEGNREQ